MPREANQKREVKGRRGGDVDGGGGVGQKEGPDDWWVGLNPIRPKNHELEDGKQQRSQQ
jgi:hypothetical protein